MTYIKIVCHILFLWYVYFYDYNYLEVFTNQTFIYPISQVDT